MTDTQKQAYEDYMNGMKYADIAAKYGLPISTVKTWANRYFKAKEVSKSDETFETFVTEKDINSASLNPISPTAKLLPARKRGGANNVRHGAYKKVTWEVLEDDEERELIEDINYTPEQILKDTYKDLKLRARRLSKAWLKVRQESEGNRNLTLGSVTKIKGSYSDGEEDKTVTVAEAINSAKLNLVNALKIYEGELTKIAAQEIKTAVELAKIQSEREKNAEGNALADDWVAAVIETQQAETNFGKAEIKNQ